MPGPQSLWPLGHGSPHVLPVRQMPAPLEVATQTQPEPAAQLLKLLQLPGLLQFPHTPLVQGSPAWHLLPHSLQLSGSVARLAQLPVPGQNVVLGGQTHWPVVASQVSGAVQVPQLTVAWPQLLIAGPHSRPWAAHVAASVSGLQTHWQENGSRSWPVGQAAWHWPPQQVWPSPQQTRLQQFRLQQLVLLRQA